MFWTTFIRYGNVVGHTSTLNHESTIDQVHETIRQIYENKVNRPYRIRFMDFQTNNTTILNQTVLDSEKNPFLLRNLEVSCNGNTTGCNLILEIIDDLDYNVPMHVESSPQVAETMLRERKGRSPQEFPINKRKKNSDESTIDAALLPTHSHQDEQIDADILHISNIERRDRSNTSVHSIYAPASSTQSNLAESCIPSSVQTYTNPNDSVSAACTTMDSGSFITEPGQTESIVATFYFHRDVKDEQKPTYKSDEFNQREKNKRNGSIARIQGVKTDAEKRRSILPQLYIATSLYKNPSLKMLVYVVSETFDDKTGSRIWCLHRDKGFLPENYSYDTGVINPIAFTADQIMQNVKNNHFSLNLRMTTMWKKFYDPTELHRLKEELVLKLHPAKHDPSSPRLLCILVPADSNHPHSFDHMCLSNFMKIKSYGKKIPESIHNLIGSF